MAADLLVRHGYINPVASAHMYSDKQAKEKEDKKMAAEEGQVIACHTTEAWEEQLRIGNETKKLIVVDFTASWCGPCRSIAPVFAELAKTTPDVTFLKVDVDEVQEVAADWDVEAMPTFLFLQEGKMVGKLVGATKDLLVREIARHAAAACAATTSAI